MDSAGRYGGGRHDAQAPEADVGVDGQLGLVPVIGAEEKLGVKWQDPSITTILCGSSNDRMPTYPEWDRVALEIAWEKIDLHSIHYYAGNRENDTPSYLAYALTFRV